MITSKIDGSITKVKALKKINELISNERWIILFSNIKEALWTIGSVVAIIVGIYTMRQIFKKKPNLTIDNASVEMSINDPQVNKKLFVSFKICNKRTWKRLTLISDAINPVVFGTPFDKDFNQLSSPSNENQSFRIPFGGCTPRIVPLEFFYNEDYHWIRIEIECNDISSSKNLKISDYLEAPQKKSV